jgi:hypothetical protein
MTESSRTQKQWGRSPPVGFVMPYQPVFPVQSQPGYQSTHWQHEHSHDWAQRQRIVQLQAALTQQSSPGQLRFSPSVPALNAIPPPASSGVPFSAGEELYEYSHNPARQQMILQSQAAQSAHSAVTRVVPGMTATPSAPSGVPASAGRGLAASSTTNVSGASRAYRKPAGYGTLAKRMKAKLDGKPKRSLSGYNIFFKEERSNILREIEEREGGNNKQEGFDDEALSSGQEDPTEGTSTFNDVGSTANSRRVSKMESLADSTLDSPVGEIASDETKRTRRKRAPGKMGFGAMAKTISERWKKIDPERLADCKRRSEDDLKRYKKELAVYKKKHSAALETTQEELESTVSHETKMRYLNGL